MFERRRQPLPACPTDGLYSSSPSSGARPSASGAPLEAELWDGGQLLRGDDARRPRDQLRLQTHRRRHQEQRPGTRVCHVE